MIAPVIAVAIAFLVLLWLVIAVRRKAIRTTLLATGVQVRGTTSFVWPRGRGPARVGVTYIDNAGVSHTAVKATVNAGDAELFSQPAHVIFDPRRANSDDYVLLGFGEVPSTWFRASFTRTAPRPT
mgnify:CR=1 FL=1